MPASRGVTSCPARGSPLWRRRRRWRTTLSATGPSWCWDGPRLRSPLRVTTTRHRPCPRRSPRRPRRGAAAGTRLAGAVAAACLTGIGGLALVRNAFTRNEGGGAGVAACACLVALMFAAMAHRACRDAIAGLTLSLIATAFAAVAGFLAVPGVPGIAQRVAGRVGGGGHLGVRRAGLGLRRGHDDRGLLRRGRRRRGGVGGRDHLAPPCRRSVRCPSWCPWACSEWRRGCRSRWPDCRPGCPRIPTTSTRTAWPPGRSAPTPGWPACSRPSRRQPPSAPSSRCSPAHRACPASLSVPSPARCCCCVRAATTPGERWCSHHRIGHHRNDVRRRRDPRSADARPWIAAGSAILAAAAMCVGFVVPALSFSPVAHRSRRIGGVVGCWSRWFR